MLIGLTGLNGKADLGWDFSIREREQFYQKYVLDKLLNLPEP